MGSEPLSEEGGDITFTWEIDIIVVVKWYSGVPHIAEPEKGGFTKFSILL